jgi:DNA uptake protein ComE-like DNA-binding protein
MEHDSIKAHYQPKIRQGEHVVLNMADTTQLKTIPGIGPYFARKIVEYGQRLGGYVSVDQLDEIEDFPLDAKDYLVIENPSPRKLNVNQLSLNELRRHPYINFYQARAITDYRRLHGPIHSLDDLRLSKDFPQEAIARLKPYVEY